jgi:hypothetical protein
MVVSTPAGQTTRLRVIKGGGSKPSQCMSRLYTGRTAGQRCPFPARFRVAPRYSQVTLLLCGVHARGWLPEALVRL